MMREIHHTETKKSASDRKRFNFLSFFPRNFTVLGEPRPPLRTQDNTTQKAEDKHP